MRARLTVTAAGLAVVVACTAAVVSRATSAPAPRARRGASAQERVGFAAAIRADEEEWLGKSEESFPSDLWSQRDNFHGLELARVRELAGAAGVPLEEVLRAVDEDLHQHPASPPGADKRPLDRRGARAVACKPRPIYD